MVIISSSDNAGNIRPVASLPQIAPEPDTTSPGAVAKALLSHVQTSGLGSPRLPPPAAASQPEPIPEPKMEPDLRQCYQMINGHLTVVSLQNVLPKPKPKGAMKKGVAGGAAGTEDS